jgi:Zn-finger nucleic acid-binding protein
MERTEGASLLCPVCRVDLVMSERQNIEIDYCPKCRGVWLDRGELDKIIERSAAEAQPVSQPNPPTSFLPPGGSNAAEPWGGSSQAPARQSEHDYDQRGYADRRGSQGGHGSHGGHGDRGGHGRGFLGRLFD